jgi:predicted DNA-binding transcriptional regulator
MRFDAPSRRWRRHFGRLHADDGLRKGDGLQPQIVLNCLRQHYADTVFTVSQIASQMGLSELSTRAQLHALLARNLVTRRLKADANA